MTALAIVGGLTAWLVVAVPVGMAIGRGTRIADQHEGATDGPAGVTP